jgi:HSP20 family protein
MQPNLDPQTRVQSETSFPEPIRTPRYWTEPRDHGLKVVVALPGYSREPLQISIEAQKLKLRSQRLSPLSSASDLRLRHRESLPGDYLLHLRLPERVDAHAIRARYEEGLLTLHLPAQNKRTRKVPIE